MARRTALSQAALSSAAQNDTVFESAHVLGGKGRPSAEFCRSTARKYPCEHISIMLGFSVLARPAVHLPGHVHSVLTDFVLVHATILPWGLPC